MPEICRFYGIIISMYYSDHNPPHFHAKYQGYEVTVSIETGEIAGEMPGRALNMIFDWLDNNKEAIWENWNLARERKPLKQIEPLI